MYAAPSRPKACCSILTAGQLLCHRAPWDRPPPTSNFETIGETIHSILPISDFGMPRLLPPFRQYLNQYLNANHVFCSEVWNTFTQQASSTVISNPATFLSTKTAIWKSAILALLVSKTLRWPAMFQRDTTEPLKSCLHGRNMTWKSTSGVQAVFLPRCWKESLYFLERTMSTSSLSSQNCLGLRRTMWFKLSAVRMWVGDRHSACYWLRTLANAGNCIRPCGLSSPYRSVNVNLLPTNSRTLILRVRLCTWEYRSS